MVHDSIIKKFLMFQERLQNILTAKVLIPITKEVNPKHNQVDRIL